jgi:hypothetical protein
VSWLNQRSVRSDSHGLISQMKKLMATVQGDGDGQVDLARRHHGGEHHADHHADQDAEGDE